MTMLSEPMRVLAEQLPRGWEVRSLMSMLSEPVRNGVYKAKEFHGRGARVVNMGELFGFEFISNQEMKRVELTPDEEKKAALSDGDLLFARRSLVLEGAGKCSLVVSPPEPTTFESSIIRARPDRRVVEPRFLFYLFASPLGRAIMASIATRTAVSGIRGSDLSQLLLPLPPLHIQRRIASILSAYDDLIDNCQRRIQILEQMARALYREWFVKFRYPGHESVPLVSSPLREIPQGWETIPFARLLASMTGGDWGSEQREGRETEEVVVVRGTDFDEVAYGGQIRAPVRYIKRSSLVSRALKVGDVIIENSINAKSRSVGTTLLVDEYVLNRLGQDAIAASFCKVLRPHDQRLAPLIHLHARHLREYGRMEYYQNVATNGIANFQAQRFAKDEHLVLPADDGERSRLVAPIAAVFNNVASLASCLANLRRTRDLLLPRLISGQIDLDAA